jgi:hypothetical protein
VDRQGRNRRFDAAVIAGTHRNSRRSCFLASSSLLRFGRSRMNWRGWVAHGAAIRRDHESSPFRGPIVSCNSPTSTWLNCCRR